MLNYYFYINFSNYLFFKKKKVNFLLSLLNELYFIITNLLFQNTRGLHIFFFKNNATAFFKKKLFFLFKFNFIISFIKSFFYLEHSFKIINSLLFLIISSMNFFFLKLNNLSLNVFPAISKISINYLITPKFLYFFKFSEESCVMRFVIKYFFFSLYYAYPCFKLSLLIGNYDFFISYENMLLFYFFDIFSEKRIQLPLFNVSDDNFRFISF